MELESRARRTLYVGGLEDSVTAPLLRAAFLPFGELKDVNLPMNHASGKHRGFGFVEFEDDEDAKEALDNMDGAELFGRTLRVTLAKPQQGAGGGAGKAVWAAGDWFANLAAQELEEEGAAGGDGAAGGPAAAAASATGSSVSGGQ
jgi:peptidyl-prolyl isomerase E (cyclophilin E)